MSLSALLKAHAEKQLRRVERQLDALSYSVSDGSDCTTLFSVAAGLFSEVYESAKRLVLIETKFGLCKKLGKDPYFA